MQSIILGLLLTNIILNTVVIKYMIANRKETEKIFLNEIAFREGRINKKIEIICNDLEEIK